MIVFLPLVRYNKVECNWLLCGEYVDTFIRPKSLCEIVASHLKTILFPLMLETIFC